MTANKSNPERGTVIVEAALTLLLLFIFLFGLVEVSRFISVQQVLTDAAREGARLRVAPLSQTKNFLASASEVKEQVCTFLTAAAVKCDRVKLCVNDDDSFAQGMTCPSLDEATYPPAGNLSYTKVHLELPYQPVMLSMFGHFSVTLKAEALMRNETESNP